MREFRQMEFTIPESFRTKILISRDLDNKLWRAFSLRQTPSTVEALDKSDSKETKWENKKETKLCLSIFSMPFFSENEEKVLSI